MSSVNGSNNNNPLAMWQSLFGQDASASGNTAAGNAPSDPLAELLATIGQATGLANGTATSGTNSSSDSSQGTTGSTSPQFGPQTLQALFDLQANASQSSTPQADDSGATGYTTTINYADGSSVTPTAASPSDSSGSTAAAGASGVTGNNLLEQLIQMQSQLLNTNTTQAITTA